MRAYPLYGTFTLEDGRPYRHALVAGHGVLVRPDLIAQLGLRVGGSVFIGQARFEIRGVISAEPGRRAGAFSLGPRVVIDRADLVSTGLIGFGSRASYQRLLQLPDVPLEPIVKRLRARLSNSFASVRSYHDTEARVRAQIEGAQHFLGLVGYVILVLGGIGVWSVTRVFLQQKRTSIAALKCLGASSWRILAVYVLQALVLGLAGSALGLLIAALGLPAVPSDAIVALGDTSLGLTLPAALHAAVLGTLVSLGSALVPLAGIRRVKPLSLLRDETEGTGASPARRLWARLDPVQALTGVVVLVLFASLAAWQAGSWRVGAFVSVGFVVVALALVGAGAVFVRLVQPLARVRWFPLRHAVHRARPAGPPDPRHPRHGRPRLLLHPGDAPGRADAGGAPVARPAARRAGPVLRRRAGRPAGRRPGAARRQDPEGLGPAAAGGAGPRRRRHRPRRQPRLGRGRPRARRPVARVRHHLARSPGVEREAGRRHVLGLADDGGAGGVDRGRHAATATCTSATGSASTSSAGRSRRR